MKMKSKDFSFKKKFRSFAILLLALLSVVSFSVGISTFDTTYQRKALAVVETTGTHLIRSVGDPVSDAPNSKETLTTTWTVQKPASNTKLLNELNDVGVRLGKDAQVNTYPYVELANSYVYVPVHGSDSSGTISLTYSSSGSYYLYIYQNNLPTSRRVKQESTNSLTFTSADIHEYSGGYYLLFKTGSSSSNSDTTRNFKFRNITLTDTYSVAAGPTTYTVTYNKNTTDTVSGMPSNASGVPAGSYTLSDATPTRSGYVFKGWATTENGTTPVTSVTVSDNTTVYAIWAQTYSVTYNANGGSNAPTDSNQYAEGDTVTISEIVPTRANYTFNGWTSSAFDGLKQASATFTMIAGNVTLTASWTETPADTYTVSFDGNSGSGSMSPQFISAGESTALNSNTFTKTGYTFSGWDSDNDGDVDYENGASVTDLAIAGGSITLKAVWTPISYTITFDKNGGNGTANDISAEYGESYDLPTLEKDNYLFLGWSLVDDDTVADYTNTAINLTTTNGDTVTLYAVWEEIPDTSIRVTYNVGSGTNAPVDSAIYESGETVVVKSGVPTQDGKSFVGWDTDPSADEVVYHAYETFNITVSTTLYAVWKNNASSGITITFNPNYAGAENITRRVASGSVLGYGNVPAVTHPDGKAFMGWYRQNDKSTNKDEFDFDEDTVSSNITLYAMWAENVDSEDYINYIKNLINQTRNNMTANPAWNTESTQRDYFNYVNGIFLDAIVNLAYNTTDETDKEFYIDFFLDFISQFVANDGRIIYAKTGTTFLIERVDFVQEVRMLFDAYYFSGEQKYLTAIENAMNDLSNIPTVSGSYNNFEHTSAFKQVWLDGMYMTSPLYARYLLARNGEPITKNSFTYSYQGLVDQFRFVATHMRDETTGLYYHGWRNTSDDAGWGSSNSTFNDGGTVDGYHSSTFWLRSFGWYIMSLVDVIGYLPDAEVTINSVNFNGATYTTARSYLSALLKDALDSVLVYQDADSKMFYQVINDDSVIKNETEENYLETSGSAMIAYTLMKAANLGVLNSSYGQIGQSVFEGVYSHSAQLNGSTLNIYDICGPVSLSDGASQDLPSYYLGVTLTSNDSKGTAPLTLAFIQYVALQNGHDVNYPKTLNFNQAGIKFDFAGGSYNGGSHYWIPYTLGNSSSTYLNLVPTGDDVSRAGYNFSGWYTDADYTTTWESYCNSHATLSGYITLYAKWVIDPTQTITVNLNITNNGHFGSDSNDKLETFHIAAAETGTYKNLAEGFIPSSSSGYTFLGFKNANGDLVYNAVGEQLLLFNASAGDTINLTAVIVESTIEVTYNFGKNSGNNSTGLGSAAYTTNNSSNFKVNNKTVSPVASGDLNVVYTVPNGESINLLQASQVDRLNYDLVGWKIGGNTYDPGASYTFNAATTVEPIWQPKNKSQILSEIVATDDNSAIWSSYILNNGTYDLTNANSSHENIRWTDLFEKTGDNYTFFDTNFAKLEIKGLAMPTDATHRSVTEPFIRIAASETFATVTVKQGYTVTITIYGTTVVNNKSFTVGADKSIGTIGTIPTSSYYGGGNSFSGFTPASVSTQLSANTYNLQNTSSNNGLITGIKIEVNSVATPKVEYRDGETLYATTYATSGKAVLPVAPTKEGFVFEGWFTEIEGGEEVDENTTVSGTLQAYARWRRDVTYTVTLNGNGGSFGESETRTIVLNNSSYTLPTVGEGLPVREGYKLIGWAKTPGGSALADNNVTLETESENIYYAVWAQTYSVTYDANGGSNAPTDSDQYAQGDTVTISTTVPTRTGYSFNGWTSTAFSGTKQVGDSFTMPDSNVTLTATWTINSYNVTYNAGESVTAENMPATVTNVAYNSTVDISTTVPTRTGYTFSGWTSTAFSGTKQVGDSFTMPDSNVTLTATWTINSYSVTYNAGESVTAENMPVTVTNVAYNSTVDISPTVPTRTGYTFSGWTSSAFEGTKLAGSSFTMPDSNVTLTATWTINSYSVTYDANGGSNAPTDSDQYAQGETVTISETVPTRTGYTFNGWTASPSVTITDGSFTMPDSNVTLTATWTINSYNVTFRNGEEQVGEVQSVEYNQFANPPAMIDTETHTFSGWATASDSTEIVNVATYNITSETIFYAVWIEKVVSDYAVSIDFASLADRHGTIDIAENDALYNEIEGYGYSFYSEFAATSYDTTAAYKGLKIKNDNMYIAFTVRAGSTVVITLASSSTTGTITYSPEDASLPTTISAANSNTITGFTTDTTLTIKRTPSATFVIRSIQITDGANPTTYTVTYDANGGSNAPTDSDQYAQGDTVTISETVPTRTGYTFNGWTSSAFEGTKLAGSSFTMPDSNVTLTATWNINSYTVTFNADGGTIATGESEYNVDYNQTIATLPTVASRTDYTFDGWFVDDVEFTTATQVTSDLTVTAKWTFTGVISTQNAVIYFNGEKLAQPDTTYGGIEYVYFGMGTVDEQRSDVLLPDSDGKVSGTVIKTGGSSKSSRYFSIKVPSAIYSSFRVKLTATSSSNGNMDIWLSSSISSSKGAGETAIVSPSASNIYLTGTSETFATSDGENDIVYYLNFSNGARFYEISLELDLNAGTQERTISFTTDDAETHPITAIPDDTVDNGGNYVITQTPTLTENVGKYSFAYWQGSNGNDYEVGDTISSINTNITLTAIWNEIIYSITAPSVTSRIITADAQSSGFGLPSTVVAHLRSGSTVNLAITWDLSNALYNENSDEFSDDTINISDSANIIDGFYKISGSISATAPSGYAYDGSFTDRSWFVVVEAYDLLESSVMAGAGYQANGTTPWNNGLTATNDIYTLSTNGDVSITVHGERVESSNPRSNGYVDVYASTSTKENAAITINMPSSYSHVIIAIRTTKATSGYIRVFDSMGTQIPTTLQTGASFNTLSINAPTSYGDKIYIGATNETEIVSIVANAQYEYIGELPTTYKIKYWTSINNNAYGGDILLSYNYLPNAKLAVKQQATSLGAHKIFKEWATGQNESGSIYNPGDILTVNGDIADAQNIINLYARPQNETPIEVTFDFNLPFDTNVEFDSAVLNGLGITGASQTKTYQIYAGDKPSDTANYLTNGYPITTLWQVPQPTTVTIYSGTDNERVYTFDGWTPFITDSSIIANSETYVATWITSTYDIKVNDLTFSVEQDTVLSQIGLPNTLSPLDFNGGVISDLDDVSVGAWVSVGETYTPSVAGTYLLKAPLTHPEMCVFYSDWANYSFNNASYDRKTVSGETTTYYVYAQVTVVAATSYVNYTADWTAFAYTGSEDHVVYNNNSNTHDKPWTDYYDVPSDENSISGTIVAQNGGIKIIADNVTKVDGNNTAALLDTDYHGQTWSMIKGYKKMSSNNAPFLYVVAPEDAKNITIYVYAVRFRASGSDINLEIGARNGAKETMAVTTHSNTETDSGSDFNYFYDFSPSYYKYTYSGNERVFTITNTTTNTNVYVTGIKVECDLPTDSSNIITYNANDGSANPQTRQVVYANDGESGNDVIIEKNFFYREGYQFIGWAQENGSEIIDPNWQVGETHNLTGNKTLYAVWERSRRVTYVSNENGDGTGDTFEKYYTNGRGPLSENEFDMTDEVRSDKIFLYWNTMANGSGDSYYPGNIYNPDGSDPKNDDKDDGYIPSDMDLYAIWGEGDLFTARYSAYSHHMNAIDMVYNNDSNTFGVDWTTKYPNGGIGKIVAQNGALIVSTNGTVGSNALSRPMIKLDSGKAVSIAVPKQGSVSITINAVKTGDNGSITVDGTNYVIDKKFTDGGSFKGFVPTVIKKSINIYDAGGGTVNITSNNNGVYIAGVEVGFVVASSSVNYTVTYDKNVENANETYSYLIGGDKSTIVDINRFHRDGYTFSGWSTTSNGGADANYSYGTTVSLPTAIGDENVHNLTLYAVWTPKTYEYQYWALNATGDGWIALTSDDSAGVHANDDFTFGGSIPKYAMPFDPNWTFMGWYLDKETYQVPAFIGEETTFVPTFDMIDSDGVVNIYAYFIENVFDKTTVSTTEIADREMWILDVVDNVYNEEHTTSATARVSSDSLLLPRVVAVHDVENTFSKNLIIDWTQAVNGLTLGTLSSGVNTFTGYVRLSDDDYDDYAFSDGTNENLQQIPVTATVTLKNLVITFPNGELVQDSFTYPIGTTKSDVISRLAFNNGQYTDRQGTPVAFIPRNNVWKCDNYNSTNGGTYSFTTTLFADFGYAFRGYDNNSQAIELRELEVGASVTITGSKGAIASVGFDGQQTRWGSSNSASDWIIDANGDAGNELKITAVGNTYDNDGQGNLQLDMGDNAIKIDVPKYTQLTVYYTSLTKNGNLILTDSTGETLLTNDLSAKYDGFVNPFVYPADALSNVNNTPINNATTFYLKADGGDVVITRLWILATDVLTTESNVIKVKFTYNDVNNFFNGFDGANQEVITGENGENTWKFVRGAKIIAPSFEETGLSGAPEGNQAMQGWDYVNGTLADYKVGKFIDLELSRTVVLENGTTEYHAQLFAIFDIAFYTITFNAGYDTLVVPVPINQTVGSVINLSTGADRDSRLLELESGKIGYEIENWYTDQTYLYTLNPNSYIHTDITVYAKWTAKQYTIRFADESGNVISDIGTLIVDYDRAFSDATINKNAIPQVEGKTFRSWTLAGNDFRFNEDTLASYSNNGIAIGTTEVVFIASYGAKVTYHTEYDGIEGSAFPRVEDENVYSIGYEYPTNKVTGLIGYTFIGWSETQNAVVGTDTIYGLSDTITLTGNITLYAVWQAQTVTVSFESGYESIDFTSISQSSITVPYNTTLSEPTASATGYVICRWYYLDGENNKITWIFEGNTDSLSPSRVIPRASGENENLTLTLYAEWGVAVTVDKFNKLDSSDEIETNLWYPTINVPINTAVPFINTQGVPNNNVKIHSEPIIPGYQFDGWYYKNVSDEYVKYVYATIPEIMVTTANQGGLTIYAGYQKLTSDTSFTLSFDDPYGIYATIPNAITVGNAENYTVDFTGNEFVATTDKAGVTFMGWTISPKGNEILDSVTLTKNTTVYAMWEIVINEISLPSVTVNENESIQDNTTQAKFDASYVSGATTVEYEDAFTSIWHYADARSFVDANNDGVDDGNGSGINLTSGAYGIVPSGSYVIPVTLRTKVGYKWMGDNPSAEVDGTINVEVILTIISGKYYIISVEDIVKTGENAILPNTDFRLSKVNAVISQDSNALSGVTIQLDVVWNSQIDSTIVGRHYVLGKALNGVYEFAGNCDDNVSATVEVKSGALSNPYLYKTYQQGTMPNSPTAPSGFDFLCWTNKGVTAVGENATNVPAGEWTATYAKVDYLGASIRLNKDYTGLRFGYALTFYGNKYVGELVRNKANLNGAISVTMLFTYQNGENTYNVGTGQDFMNMTYSEVDGNAVITFAGVISDLITINDDFTVSGTASNRDIEFTPTAKIKLNGSEVSSFTSSGVSHSASDVATTVLTNYASQYPEGSYGYKILQCYKGNS